jgi:pimeloyl-ACP methyl ester carboxylesterase
MADLYVLVHGAWHTGAEMEAVAAHLRKDGHHVHCPTIAGNNAGDDRSKIGLEEAIASIANYIESNGLKDVRLVGHSYGGMIISGVADRLADRIKRLVYINAFVPLNGECLNDMVPPHYIGLFDAVAGANNNAVMLPFEIWRESFINDADFALAKSAFATFRRQVPGSAWSVSSRRRSCCRWRPG